jgi:hypothetical protein
MIEYVKTNLREQLCLEAPVHAVSVLGAGAILCDQWFESELRPFLAQHQQLAIISLKRKIGVLRETVIGALERRLQVKSVSHETSSLPGEAREALREGDRVLERAQGESFFLTRKIAKMHRAIIDIVAQRIAAALRDSDSADPASIFSETLTQMIAEPVAATRRSIEQTRDALTRAVERAAASSGHGTPDELPRLAGMPMLDVNEISQTLVIEKPRILWLLGKRAVASNVQRQLEQEYDRALLEFLSLYANRLRRWMEQSIAALRNGFNAFADMYRARFESAPATAACADSSAVEHDLQILREWNATNHAVAVSSI